MTKICNICFADEILCKEEDEHNIIIYNNYFDNNICLNCLYDSYKKISSNTKHLNIMKWDNCDEKITYKNMLLLDNQFENKNKKFIDIYLNNKLSILNVNRYIDTIINYINNNDKYEQLYIIKLMLNVLLDINKFNNIKNTLNNFNKQLFYNMINKKYPNLNIENIKIFFENNFKYFNNIDEIVEYYCNNIINIELINKLNLKEEVLIYSLQNNIYYCPKNNCNGKIIDNKCSLCHINICKECHQELKDNHKCNFDLLKYIIQTEKDIKHCPKCNHLVIKNDGCSDMWCDACLTIFNWETLEIQTSTTNEVYKKNIEKIKKIRNQQDNQNNNSYNRKIIINRLDYPIIDLQCGTLLDFDKCFNIFENFNIYNKKLFFLSCFYYNLNYLLNNLNYLLDNKNYNLELFIYILKYYIKPYDEKILNNQIENILKQKIINDKFLKKINNLLKIFNSIFIDNLILICKINNNIKYSNNDNEDIKNNLLNNFNDIKYSLLSIDSNIKINKLNNNFIDKQNNILINQILDINKNNIYEYLNDFIDNLVDNINFKINIIIKNFNFNNNEYIIINDIFNYPLENNEIINNKEYIFEKYNSIFSKINKN